MKEHDQPYYLLKNGSQKPYHSPINLEQVWGLIRSGSFDADDYIYSGEWEFWKKIGEVLEIPYQPGYTVVDGQDPYVAEEAFEYINTRALPNEELYYIAVQHVPALKITSTVRLSMPSVVILTNQRFCILEHKRLNEPDFHSFPLKYIENGVRKLKPRRSQGSFIISLTSGCWFEVDKLPQNQLDKLYSYSKYILDESNQNLSQSRTAELVLA